MREGRDAPRLTPVWAGDGKQLSGERCVEPPEGKSARTAGCSSCGAGTTRADMDDDGNCVSFDDAVTPAARRPQHPPSDGRGRCCFRFEPHGRTQSAGSYAAAPGIEVTGPQAQAMNHGLAIRGGRVSVHRTAKASGMRG